MKTSRSTFRKSPILACMSILEGLVSRQPTLVEQSTFYLPVLSVLCPGRSASA